MTVPIDISLVKVPVRKRRPVVKKEIVWFPVLYPSSWIPFLLQHHSYLLLGGLDLHEPDKWQRALDEFWGKYKACDKDHIMHEASAPPTTHTVPIYIHGDEGRGKYRLPIMDEAFQPCLSFQGTAYKNSSGSLPRNSFGS